MEKVDHDEMRERERELERERERERERVKISSKEISDRYNNAQSIMVSGKRSLKTCND